MSRITQVSYGETTSKDYQSRKLELTATVDEGEDPMAVYHALKSTVRKTLGIGPTQEDIDKAIKTLDDAGMVQQRTPAQGRTAADRRRHDVVAGEGADEPDVTPRYPGDG